MIQNILRHLGGIEQYGVVSLCLFCLIFVMVLVWAFLQKQSHLDRMSRVPLENEPENFNNRENSHE
jgi:hypothetical protein